MRVSASISKLRTKVAAMAVVGIVALAAMIGVGAALVQAAPPAGLVARYSFDNNDAADSSGNGNNGTLAGSPTFAPGPSGFGNALVVDLGKYVILPSTNTLSLYNHDFTVTAWVNASAFSGLGGYGGDWSLLGNQGFTGGSGGLHLVLRGGQLYMGFFGNDMGGPSVSLNTWYHIAWRYNKATGEMAMFLNGAQVATQGGHPPFIGTGSTYIGRSADGWDSPRYAKGMIDDVQIYNRPLTQAEVASLTVAPPNPTASACAPNVAEASQYSLVYELPIPVSGSNYTSSPPLYSVDNSASTGAFNRIAYCLQLNSNWVWVSMDAFTTVPSRIGVPTVSSGAVFQQFVSNMNVASSSGAGVVTGTGIATGNIEFWPTNYNQRNLFPIPGASSSTFDFGDTPTPGTYGSMQVHNYGAQQTIFGYNNWGGGGTTDLGIGNSPTGQPDWTFRNNANTYSVRNLKMYVGQVQTDSTPPVVTPTVIGTLGNNGWYTSNVNVSWTVTDPESAFTTTGCEAQNVTSDTAGVSFTCSATSAGGSASASVTIKRDATPPTATGSATPAPNGNGWNNTDVTVAFTCADAFSGIASCLGNTTLTGEGAGQSATGTATDMAGNSASTTVSGINIDKTAPTISGSASPAPNANGWNNTDVSVSFTCADTLSTIDTCVGNTTLTAEGAGQSASGTATDQAGNTASTTVSGINIDKTAPTATGSASPAPAASGWYNIATGAPTISFTGSDATSGIASCTSPVTVSTDGENQSVSGSCTDSAGNVSSFFDVFFDIDLTAPTASGSASPAPAASGWYNIATGAPTISFSGSDATSGIASCTSPVTVSTDGEDQSISGSCTDNAGNVSSFFDVFFDIDLTAPTISGARTPAANANGWNNTDVAVTFTCGDALSGVASCIGNTTLTAEGAGQSATGTATDLAGNTASTTVSGINIDKTAPSITASQSPAANGAGWNNTNVTVSFTCSDALSGLAVPCPVSTTLTANGANQSVTGAVTDLAGNSASATRTVSIDKTAPEAYNQFNPATLDIQVIGRDGGSGIGSVTVTSTTVKWGDGDEDDDGDDDKGSKAELRTYTVTDAAGNTLVLVEKVKKSGHEIKVSMVSLRYNGGAVIALPENSKSYEWSLNKDGSLKELEQKMEVGKGKAKQSVEAKYEGKKNLTTIKVDAPKPETKVVKPGLALLRLATSNGSLVIEY